MTYDDATAHLAIMCVRALPVLEIMIELYPEDFTYEEKIFVRDFKDALLDFDLVSPVLAPSI